jgi:hypothetical protein
LYIRGNDGKVDLFIVYIDPNVVKVERLQSQGGKDEAVVDYREPLITPAAGHDLMFSGFPEG